MNTQREKIIHPRPKYKKQPVQLPDTTDPGQLETQVRGLLDKSRSLVVQKPMVALELAQQAFDIARQLDNRVLIDAVMVLISRFGRVGQQIERDRLLDEYRDLIEREATVDQMAYYLNTSAVVHLEKADFSQALGLLRKAVDSLDLLSDPMMRTIIKINLGNCYRGIGVNEKAIKWFYNALEDAQKNDDLVSCSHIYNNLGVLHRTIQDNERAIEFFEKVIEFAEKTNDQATLAKAYNNLCTANYYLEKFDLALQNCQKSYELSLKINDRFGIQSCLTNFGVFHQKLEEYDSAMSYFERALQIASSLGHKHQIANLLKNVADIHFARREFDQVVPLYDKALALAEEISAQDMLNDLYRAYVQFFENVDDWERALKYQKLLSEVQYTLFIGKQREVIEEYRIRYESEQKEREAELLREKNALLEQEIAERKMVEAELKEAISRIKVLTGLLPVCSHCKKIRDKKGEWHQMEHYISTHTEAQFSHGICPECRKEHYGQE